MIVTGKCGYCETEVELEAESSENICPSCGKKISSPKNPMRYFTPAIGKDQFSAPFCPYCRSELPRGNQGMTRNEIGLFILLLLLAVVPGLIYGFYITSKPYCRNCDRRV
jgi:DNA-directed RNA polymerase subunit RPC12/RpoP